MRSLIKKILRESDDLDWIREIPSFILFTKENIENYFYLKVYKRNVLSGVHDEKYEYTNLVLGDDIVSKPWYLTEMDEEDDIIYLTINRNNPRSTSREQQRDLDLVLNLLNQGVWVIYDQNGRPLNWY